MGTVLAWHESMQRKSILARMGTMTRSLIAAAMVLAMPAAWGGALQSHDSILQAATEYARGMALAEHGADVEVVPGRLDRRLRLAACDRPLQTFTPPGRRSIGNTTVGVRCEGSNPWTLYVPITVNVYGEVVVTRTALSRGELIDASKVKVARYNLAKLPQGYFHDPVQVQGMLARRNLAAGQPLVPAMLKAQKIVERGQRVTMLAGGNGLEVRMPGVALSHGARGERIRVRNLSSKRVVEGVVVEPGLVRVDR